MAGDNLQNSNSKAPKIMYNGHTSSGRWGSDLDATASHKGSAKDLPGRLTKG